jgi:hypothetical protein
MICTLDGRRKLGYKRRAQSGRAFIDQIIMEKMTKLVYRSDPQRSHCDTLSARVDCCRKGWDVVQRTRKGTQNTWRHLFEQLSEAGHRSRPALSPPAAVCEVVVNQPACC